MEGDPSVSREPSFSFLDNDDRVPPIPSDDVAYTAGFFDGEGCINIARYYKRGRPYHTLAVIFTNTNFDVLRWLQARWGGKIYHPAPPTNPRWRLHGNLRFSAGPARPLLLAMLPHLIIKKSEAEIALQFMEAKSVNRGRQGDPVALAKREALALRMPRPRSRLRSVNHTFTDVARGEASWAPPDQSVARAARDDTVGS